MTQQPSVAVLGASADPEKYGNISLHAHLKKGYRVYPINPKEDQIDGLKAYARLADVPESKIDRITVYLRPSILLGVLDEIASVPHDELFLNPGTESPEVLARAEELGLAVIQACSIVDLNQT